MLRKKTGEGLFGIPKKAKKVRFLGFGVLTLVLSVLESGQRALVVRTLIRSRRGFANYFVAQFVVVDVFISLTDQRFIGKCSSCYCDEKVEDDRAFALREALFELKFICHISINRLTSLTRGRKN